MTACFSLSTRLSECRRLSDLFAVKITFLQCEFKLDSRKKSIVVILKNVILQVGFFFFFFYSRNMCCFLLVKF